MISGQETKNIIRIFSYEIFNVFFSQFHYHSFYCIKVSVEYEIKDLQWFLSKKDIKKLKSEIFFARMFGTFEAERSDIKIVYGLVDQPQFFNPIKHQVRFKQERIVHRCGKLVSLMYWQ